MDDVTYKIGTVNPSGIGSEVYFIPKRDIRRWPTIVDDFESALAGNYTGYQGSFVLQPGKRWNRLYSTHGKGKISWEYQGEADCKVVVNKAILSYPKLNNAGRALAKYASNGDFVFIVRHDGMFYVVGNRDYRATVTPNGDSGDAPGSAKGITLEITCPDTTPLPTYSGSLILSDGILDCNTKSFINYEDMNTNEQKNYTSQIQNGNTVRFEALGKEGRIHLEGNGTIKMEVSVDGVNYTTVEHEVKFSDGKAIAPFSFYLGDIVRISASKLTKVKVNYNNLKSY